MAEVSTCPDLCGVDHSSNVVNIKYQVPSCKKDPSDETHNLESSLIVGLKISTAFRLEVEGMPKHLNHLFI